MSDDRELKAIAEYLAGCGNLKDAAFIRSIAIRIKELEAERDAAYLELYKIQPVIKAVFDRAVWEKVKRAAAPEVR